jgi:hypothetical protein
MIAIPTMCLMAAGMGGCNYVRVTDYQLDSGQMGWGLIWREESDYEDSLTSRRIQCTAYTKSQRDSFDGIWKLGMAFAYIAIIIVSISSIAALALACATYSQRWKNVLTACFAVGAICQVLTFVVMASNICEEMDHDCTLSFGAGITVGGIACSLVAAATIYRIIPPSHVRKAAVAYSVAASDREEEEDRDDEHADSVTEDDTQGAAADLEAGLDHDTDDVEETEGVFVQEEGKGEEKEETQDLNPFAANAADAVEEDKEEQEDAQALTPFAADAADDLEAAEDEERNPFAGSDDDDDRDDSMKPVIDTDSEYYSDARLSEEDVEAIIDEGRDESGVEYDKAEALGKKKLP